MSWKNQKPAERWISIWNYESSPKTIYFSLNRTTNYWEQTVSSFGFLISGILRKVLKKLKTNRVFWQRSNENVSEMLGLWDSIAFLFRNDVKFIKSELNDISSYQLFLTQSFSSYSSRLLRFIIQINCKFEINGKFGENQIW